MAQFNLSGSGTSGSQANPTYTTTKVYQIKTQTSGVYKYVGESEPGTAQATAEWRAFRVDQTDPANPITLFADGNDNFDNVATDLTTLTYS